MFGENPLFLFAVLLATAALPLLVLSATSFVKLNVVFGILRNALGGGQIPSGGITTLLSLVLTLQIMLPVGLQMASVVREELKSKFESPDVKRIRPGDNSAEMADLIRVERLAISAAGPLEVFLRRRSHQRERMFFAGLSQASISGDGSPRAPSSAGGMSCRDVDRPDAECLLPNESIFSLVPAFLVSQLREAFEVGFLLFLPFLVIDLVVANLLVGLGMVMVSPVSVSLPFKLILFVTCDGWFLLSRGLIESYR